MKRILAYGTLACLALAGCENDMNAVAAFDTKKLGVEQAFDVETIVSQSATVKGVLTSPYMERHVSHPPHTDFPKTLQVIFYDSTARKESILTANFGRLDEGNNDIYLRDSVVFISLTTAQRLDCKDLRWDSKSAQFITDRFCRLATPTDTLYGQGFRANQDFSRTEFVHVYGTFAPPDSTFSLE
ncbi:LPS export ABC transporter periplasmic protein LptC [Chitinophaga sp.]|uniref:LPS export ABC transporter periplasmic protein LptC n=1 Tax=Chitinophaga sp. TaxID=1869181 RepID=UPI0026199A11|nr:LPS export ABC transporter periplasmic protein LptC [uncultured Chitinophaga sp.]